jgi:hypothetical protein
MIHRKPTSLRYLARFICVNEFLTKALCKIILSKCFDVSTASQVISNDVNLEGRNLAPPHQSLLQSKIWCRAAFASSPRCIRIANQPELCRFSPAHILLLPRSSNSPPRQHSHVFAQMKMTDSESFGTDAGWRPNGPIAPESLSDPVVNFFSALDLASPDANSTAKAQKNDSNAHSTGAATLPRPLPPSASPGGPPLAAGRGQVLDPRPDGEEEGWRRRHHTMLDDSDENDELRGPSEPTDQAEGGPAAWRSVVLVLSLSFYLSIERALRCAAARILLSHLLSPQSLLTLPPSSLHTA